MSEENQKIAPGLLDDANPVGLKPGTAVNGGMDLREKPRGIRKINKTGIIIAAGIVGVAAIVATTTFNGTGSAVNDAAKDAVSNQGKGKDRPANLKRDGLWYANVPDKLETDSTPAPVPTPTQTLGSAGSTGGNSDASATAGGDQQVPDLTGKAISPLAAATAGKTGAAPYKPGAPQSTTAPPAGTGGVKAAQAAQQGNQTAQRTQQDLDQAMKAGLSAPGFSDKDKAGSFMAGLSPAGLSGNGNGTMPTVPVLPSQQKEDDPNKQERKDQFMKSQQSRVADIDYSNSRRNAPRSEFEVKAGSIIPAVMIGGINSDLPGEVIAQVRENVFDTKSGRFLLIPQGSRLVGLYDAHVAYGQRRILMAWNRLIYPDGSSFDLKGMPGADKGGYAGFFDEVDNHYMKIFGSAVMMSLISAGVQLSQPNNGSNNTNAPPTVSQTVSAALGQQIGQTAMTITQKNLNIQPTLEIRPGYQFNVMVTADMILSPPER